MDWESRYSPCCYEYVIVVIFLYGFNHCFYRIKSLVSSCFSFFLLFLPEVSVVNMEAHDGYSLESVKLLVKLFSVFSRSNAGPVGSNIQIDIYIKNGLVSFG